MGGKTSDISDAQPLLNEAQIPNFHGRTRKRYLWLLADNGYEAKRYAVLRRVSDAIGHLPTQNEVQIQTNFQRLLDRPKYPQRNIIERMFGVLKDNRRIVTRVDNLSRNYAAMVSQVCAIRFLRH